MIIEAGTYVNLKMMHQVGSDKGIKGGKIRY